MTFGFDLGWLYFGNRANHSRLKPSRAGIAFRKGLRELEYVEGQNYVINARSRQIVQESVCVGQGAIRGRRFLPPATIVIFTNQ